MSHPIRVLLADDHPLICVGIRAVLAATPTIELVGETTDGCMTQQMCQELHPTVLLLALDLPGPPTMEIVAFVQTHCPATQVLLLSSQSSRTNAQQLLSAGVAGCVRKTDVPTMLVSAIHAVAQGGTWFSQSMLIELARGQTEQTVAEPLTAREQQILSLLARGWNNAQIAAELHLDEQTVRNHIRHIYAKLGVRSRAEAIVWAHDQGFV
jgi:DNA-binding NarL/FixJ family response regulator